MEKSSKNLLAQYHCWEEGGGGKGEEEEEAKEEAKEEAGAEFFPLTCSLSFPRNGRGFPAAPRMGGPAVPPALLRPRLPSPLGVSFCRVFRARAVQLCNSTQLKLSPLQKYPAPLPPPKFSKF